MDIIKSVFFHPEIINEITDRPVQLPLGDNIYWLAVMKDALVGMLLFLPIYGVAWNSHIAILPEHRGCGSEAMAAGVDWMFANTQCQKMLAFPFKPIMKRLYEKCGFSVEGQSPKLLDVRGALIDCIIVGKVKNV